MYWGGQKFTIKMLAGLHAFWRLLEKPPHCTPSLVAPSAHHVNLRFAGHSSCCSLAPSGLPLIRTLVIKLGPPREPRITFNPRSLTYSRLPSPICPVRLPGSWWFLWGPFQGTTCMAASLAWLTWHFLPPTMETTWSSVCSWWDTRAWSQRETGTVDTEPTSAASQGEK